MRDDVNVIIINHGEFGHWLIKSAELIIGQIDNVQAFSLVSGMSIESLIKAVESYARTLKGHIIIMTDMFGGTPNNVAMYIKQKYLCEVISGVNLPMLLELILSRESDESYDTIVDKCVIAGKKSIINQQIADINNDLKEE